MRLIDRRFFLEALTIVVAAVICASIANALAARERKVRWSTSSSTLPARTAPTSAPTQTASATGTLTETATVAPTTATETTSAIAPAPVAPTGTTKPVVTPTTTAAPPKPATTATAPPLQPAPAALNLPPHPDKPWVEVSGDIVEALHRQKAPFFDARRTDVYRDGHIAGAENISVWEADVDEKVKAIYERNLDPEKPIVVYCSGGACEDSHHLAEKLWGIGLNNVVVYKDGFPDWVARNQPVNKGPNP